jgi:hypothetical protein
MIQEHLSSVNCAVSILGGVRTLSLTLVSILERRSTDVRFTVNVFHVKGFFWFIIKLIQNSVDISVKFVLEVSEQKGTFLLILGYTPESEAWCERFTSHRECLTYW